MNRLYRYQGPQAIVHAVASHPEGYLIRSVADLEHWMRQTKQQMNRWGQIEATYVINQEGILYPDTFTQVYLFRRCSGCQQLNLIKEELFVCALCGSELPQEWNFE